MFLLLIGSSKLRKEKIMEEIEKLETAVGKKIEQWNVSDLEKFSLDENLELLQLLKQPKVISECLGRSKANREVADILVPLYIKSLLSSAENAANDLLRDHESGKITLSELQTKIETDFLNNSSFYFKLTGAVIILSLVPEYELSKYEIDLKTSISQLKEVICGLSEKALNECYTLILDLLELLFPLRSKYFQKYEIDLLDDEDERLSTTLDSIHEYELFITEQIKNWLVEDQTTESEESNG